MATAIGARRRLQALANRGWSASAIEREGLGISTEQAEGVLSDGGHVSPELADRVSACYDRLWDRQPPQRTGGQRDAMRAAQKRAGKAGWCPPLAWDDDELDDPAARPAEGWRRSSRKTLQTADLLEDAEFARATGYNTPELVAIRLGISRDRLDHAYIRAARQADAEREAG